VQHLPVVGMGDVDECPGALAQVAAVHFCNTVFGYDVVYVSACGHHTRSRLKEWRDARYAFFRTAGEGKYGFAPLAQCGPRA
jgi:hypothetical protein